jgi:hypothetical protein
MTAMIIDETDACLEIYDLKPAPGRPANFICAFLLPEGSLDSWVVDMSISSDVSSCHPHGSTPPFSVSSHNKLFTIAYEAVSGTGNTLKALLFLPMSTILDHLAKSRTNNAVKNIPWEEWGPHGTRFITLDHELSDVWICHTYGMKFMMACNPTSAGQFRSVCLYDFNNLSIRRDCLSPGNSTTVLTSPSVIEASDGIFAESVHTHLPCRCHLKDLPICDDGKYEAVMMSEDCLLAVAVGHLALWLPLF